MEREGGRGREGRRETHGAALHLFGTYSPVV